MKSRSANGRATVRRVYVTIVATVEGKEKAAMTIDVVSLIEGINFTDLATFCAQRQGANPLPCGLGRLYNLM